MAYEKRTIVYREPWLVDSAGQTVRLSTRGRPRDPVGTDYDLGGLTEKGLILGVAVLEGDASDRPGQTQMGQSEEVFVTFPVGSDLTEAMISTEVEKKAREIERKATIVAKGKPLQASRSR